MIPLTNKENESYKKQKVCHVCGKIFSTDDDDDDDDDDKKYHKVRDHCHYTGKYRGAAHSICNLRYKIPKEILVVFHNGSTCDYHFIIKEQPKEFEGQFECLGQNTEKYITFSVPINKELDNGKLIKYKLKFIDSFRFMSTSLSKLVNILSEIYSKKCRDKNCKFQWELKGIKNKLSYNCKECRKPINGLIKKFPNTYKFWNNDINKFILLLKKGVYPYEYMNSWKRFDEASLPDKKAFYSKLNLEDITDEDYIHAQKVFEEFKLKNLDECHDLYVQSDTLLLADVFENFRNKCIEIYEFDPAHFLSAPGLAWQACLKKTGIKLELLTNNDILMMVEKGIRGGICHAIHRHAKANNKYMKNYDKNIESSYLMYLDTNNFYGWAMSQRLLVNGFK